MSIQGNINGMLGTVAGAAAAGKHLKKQSEQVAAENKQAEELAGLKEQEKARNTLEAARAGVENANLIEEVTTNTAKQLGEATANAVDRYNQLSESQDDALIPTNEMNDVINEDKDLMMYRYGMQMAQNKMQAQVRLSEALGNLEKVLGGKK